MTLRQAVLLCALLITAFPTLSAGTLTNTSFVESPDGSSFTSTWTWIGPGAATAATPAAGAKWNVTLTGLANGSLDVAYGHLGIHAGEAAVANAFVLPNVFFNTGGDSRTFRHPVGHVDILSTSWDFSAIRTAVTVNGQHVPEPGTAGTIALAAAALASRFLRKPRKAAR